MADDTLDYLDEVYRKMKRLDAEFVSTVTIDEEKIARAVEQKMKRGLSRRTTESIGI